MTVTGATLHNLKNVTVDIPTGVLTVVTGVAGSGKSTLINDVFLAQHPEAIVIDQSARERVAAGPPRPPTPGSWTTSGSCSPRPTRSARRFSASTRRAPAPNCHGLGVIYTDLAFMDGLKSPCEVCEGQRFSGEVLAYTLRGKSISDVLDMTAAEALAFFTEKKLQAVLHAMNDVGPRLPQLGQPLSTLSGGEGQRLKLATELHKEGSVYVMDEPTTGLHLSDIGQLLEIIDRLVDAGNTVIVIEHHLDVIKHADWIIDLGPEGGSQGGNVIFTGTPRDLLDARGSFTAEFLRREVGHPVTAS